MSNNTLIQNDKDHVWHHLTQHKGFESTDPMMVAKAKGMVVTIPTVTSILMEHLAVYGQ